jgi:uncharacterized protein with FMN-binding domain
MNFSIKLMAGLFGLLLVTILTLFLLLHLAGRKADHAVNHFQVDISRMKDGRYHGSFSFLGRMDAEVEFEIRQGKLVEYQFLKLTGTPGYGADYAVTAQIDARKDLNFDAASGATITSNFARAAIRDAVENGPVSDIGP